MSDQPKTEIDVEHLVQWAMAQTGYLPWRNPSRMTLAWDHGWTAVPRKSSRYFVGTEVSLKRALNEDAAAVISAIKSLDGSTAAVVIACGRERIRPNCLAGIIPQRVAKYRRSRKKHRKILVGYDWHPVHPDAICLARENYQRWHDGLMRVARIVDDTLIAFEINSLNAPARPWETEALEIA